MSERRAVDPPGSFPPPGANWGRSIQDYDHATAPDSASLLRKNLDEARSEADAGHVEAARDRLERLRPALTVVERRVTPYSSRTGVSLLAAAVLAALGRLHEGQERAELFLHASYLFRRGGSATDIEFNVRDRAEVALALVESGHIDRARELIAELSQNDQQWTAVAIELGEALERCGEGDLAGDIYDEAVGLLQEDWNALSRLGEALHRVGRAQRAAEAIRDAAIALARWGRTDESHALVDRALAEGLPPDALVEVKTDLLMGAGEAEQALELLDRYASDHPESPRLLANHAMSLLVLGRVEDALELAARARVEGSGEPTGAFVEALALEALGRLEEALAALEVAIVGDPANPSLHFARAQLQARLGRLDDALGSIDAACELDPLLDDALVFRASTLRQLGNLSEAAATARTALERTPEDAAAMTELGLTLLATGEESNVPEALTALERSAALAPGDAWVIAALGVGYVHARRLDDAIARLLTASELDPSLTWPRDRLADLLIETEDPGAALEVLDGLLRDTDVAGAPPDQVAVWHARRGEVLRQLGRLDEARTALEESLALAPDDVYALGTLGQVLVTRGQADEGIERLWQAVRVAPATAWIVAALAATLISRGDSEEALDVIADAHDHGLERSQMVVLLEGMRGELGDDEAMLALLASARARRPTWAEASLVSSRLLAALGRLEDALAEVDRLLEAEPDWDDALAARCVMLTALGRPERANETIDRVLARDPANEAFVRAKLSLLGPVERFEEMLVVLDSALERRPDADWLHFERANALLELGRNDAAAAALEKLVRLRPDPSVVSDVVAKMRELRGPEATVEMLRSLLAVVRLPERRVAIGWQLGALGAGADSLAAADAVLKDSPANPSALLLRGVRLVELERPLEGLASLTQAADRTPDPVLSFAMVAKALCDVGCYHVAVEWADRALHEQSDDDVSLSIRAWALQNMGEHELALASWQGALEVTSDEVWYQKGLIDCLILTGHREQALPHLNGLLARADSPTPTMGDHALQGWLLYRAGRFQDASDQFIAALSVDSLSLSSQFDLGLTTLCGGNGRRALAEYQRGVRASNAQPQLASGWLQVARKDLQDAANENPSLRDLDAYERIERLLSSACDDADADVRPQLRTLGLVDGG